MTKEMYWWSAIIVIGMFLITVFVLNGSLETKKQEYCKQERIRAFPKDFFTWKGIQELGAKGQYQPKCI